jgi:E3 Ubiquitin ligase
MGIIIGGAVVAIIGLILWMVKGKKEGQSAAMELADTATVAEVKENFESITGSLGSGSFTHFVELKGRAHAASPITSELAKEAVIYYKSSVIHKYERLEEKKDSQGKITKNWVKKTETVSENEHWANDWGVQDDTGFIAIDAAKAKLDTEKLMSKFEKGELQQSGLNVKIAGLNIGIGGSGQKDYRSIGYEYTETGIKMNTDLYVLGDANDRDGDLRVSKSQDKKQPFIVSTKSEDELVSGLGSSIKGLKIGAYICWGLGAVGVVVGAIMAVTA